MPLTRAFTGWELPAAETMAAAVLPADLSAPPDLEDTLIVAPTRQAGRRLREAMALRCARAETALLSSRVETPAFFTRTGADGRPPPASDGEVLAAWTSLLVRADLDAFPVLFPAPPPDRDTSWALRTARLLQELRDTLADGGETIASALARLGDELEERDRWDDMARLETQYLGALEDAGLRDPCLYKLACADDPVLPDGVTRLVVAAVPDPTELMVRALRALAGRMDVRILVHAPEALADRFDALGRPDPAAWTDAPIDIPNPADTLCLAATPADQAARVVAHIADLPADWGGADVAVGVPDAAVTPAVAAALAEQGLQAYDPAGRFPERHAVFTLARALADWTTQPDVDSLAALLRHPDLLRHLATDHGLAPDRLLAELDDCRTEHLPVTIDDVRRAAAPHTPACGRARRNVDRALDRLERIRGAIRSGRPIAGLRTVLQEIYATRRLARRRPADADFAAVAALFDEAAAELDTAFCRGLGLSPAQELGLLLERWRAQRYYPEREDAAIDLEGWLELAWNGAPALIVTGMNDGIVPDTRLGDPFLPETLRARLGLRHDGTRLARDVYLMNALLAPRRAGGRVYVVVGKTSPGGDPLKPSRLLFHCPDEELAARAALLFGEAAPRRRHCPSSVSFRLRPPPPDAAAEGRSLTALSVTAFRAYLACPFRFYLHTVLGMEAVDDAKTEMDARDFGKLIHFALQGLAACAEQAGGAPDAGALAAFLHDRADAWMRDRYGSRLPLQLRIQRDAAYQRLERAAHVQAALAAEGWETVLTEAACRTEIDGMTVKGMIDRVDRHRASGAVRIIDYKTADTAATPRKAHLASPSDDAPAFAETDVNGKPARWIDLQLPLYHALLREQMELPENVTLGYFNLPKAVSETGLSLWEDLTPALLAAGRQCARGVIDAVRRRRFWPPAARVAHDPFDCILYGDPAGAVDPHNLTAVREESPDARPSAH